MSLLLGAPGSTRSCPFPALWEVLGSGSQGASSGCWGVRARHDLGAAGRSAKSSQNGREGLKVGMYMDTVLGTDKDRRKCSLSFSAQREGELGRGSHPVFPFQRCRPLCSGAAPHLGRGGGRFLPLLSQVCHFPWQPSLPLPTSPSFSGDPNTSCSFREGEKGLFWESLCC